MIQRAAFTAAQHLGFIWSEDLKLDSRSTLNVFCCLFFFPRFIAAGVRDRSTVNVKSPSDIYCRVESSGCSNANTLTHSEPERVLIRLDFIYFWFTREFSDWPRYFWNKSTFSTRDDRVRMLEVISHVADNLKWKCRKPNDWSGTDGHAKKTKNEPFVLQFMFILQEQSGASMRPTSAELWHHIMSFISPLSRFFFFYQTRYWKKAQRL